MLHTFEEKDTLVQEIRVWKKKTRKCSLLLNPESMCSPCIAAVGDSKEPCISLTGARELFSQMTEEQLGNIGRLFAEVFTDSVCTVTKSELGKELLNRTPPWGVLGLGYSLRDFSFNLSNYSSHHALGTLADQLVRKGMLRVGFLRASWHPR